MSDWIKSADKTPNERGSYFVCYKGDVRLLCWNEYYENWDTEDGDDYFCDDGDVSHWMPFNWPDKPSDI